MPKTLDKCISREYYVTQKAVRQRRQSAGDGRKEQSGMFTKSFYFYYFSVDCRFAF